MTEKYPELTVENVVYWYWKQEPKYSILDISNETGAPISTVHNFMKTHNIKRRTLSDAFKNAWNTNHKKKVLWKGIISMQTPEARKKRGATLKLLFHQDPELLKNQVSNLRKFMNDPARYTQWRENIATTNRNPVKRKAQSESLKKFYQTQKGKDLRKRIVRLNTKYLLDPKDIINRYEVNKESILDIASVKGCSSNVISRILKNNGVTIRTLSEAIKIRCLKNAGKKRVNIGKKQRELLELLNVHTSLFFADFVFLLKVEEANKDALGARLRTLNRRDFVSREKEYNKHTNRLQYLYTITDFGKNILHKK